MSTPKVGNELPLALRDRQILDQDGQTLRLGDLWSDEPVLLVFLRHFGCIGCSQHLHHMLPRLPEMERFGIRIVLIGNGNADYIEGFRERHGLSGYGLPVYTDPSLESHRAAGLVRSWWGAFGLPGLTGLLKGLYNGYSQGPIQGDPPQQSGAILVDGQLVVRYYYRARTLGDFPDTNAIFHQILAMNASALGV